MVRFARECMYKSYELTKKLEVKLGPDTGELSMRFGLHRYALRKLQRYVVEKKLLNSLDHFYVVNSGSILHH
jgi:hypothetical protein